MAGLTPDGFLAKTEQELLQEFKDLLAADFGPATDTNTDQAIMQMATPIIMELSELWEGYQLLYNFLNPNAAEGASLDNIGAITSTPRLAGSKSVVTVEATGNEGATISSGFIRSVQDTGAQFRTTSSQTLPAVGLQPLVFTMDSIEDGEVAAPANTLNQGPLPSGITDIINPTDANLGTEDETDEEYRAGRVTRLASIGAGTVVAIKAALLTTTSSPVITSVAVFENDTSVTDISIVPALPPHSIRALVQGGADQDIIDTMGAKKGAGTFTDGTVSGTFTDPTDGQTFTIRFSRVNDVPMYVTVDVTSKDGNYTSDQDIENAILALTWEVGEDVVLPKLQNAVTSVPGIITYTLFFAKTITPITDTTVVIAVDELADFDSTRTTVTS